MNMKKKESRGKTPVLPLMGDLFDGFEAEPAPSDEMTTLSGFVEQSYLEYAMSVVMGRALPDVADGQKPVQRRILFAMHELGLYRPARHVKSARVVGDVIGKYHPHGDTAAYDALVRQAQDFVLRYPLIDGQGNFGSRDGDGAAAMRYTECRLTPLAELLLGEIDQDTVDFVSNYDGAFLEPRLLPARLPMVLLNGASGIGVGMATEIPSHNLGEVMRGVLALLERPDMTLEDLMEHIPGPDLPGGGQIISTRADIIQAYRTGRGSLRMRANWTVENQARGQWRIIVHELPYGVSTRDVLEDVEKIINPRLREGKKTLSPEQTQLKTLWLNALELVRDESDKSAPIRLVFEPKSGRQHPETLVHLLLAHTRLESNLPINLVMLGRDGRPRPKDLKTILQEWLEFRFDTVVRRTRFRLERVEKRLHLLLGRQKILLDIDAVISLIRESDDPKVDLMQAYELTVLQAEDILEIRLRQLARLEGIKIDREIGELHEQQSDLGKILSGRAAQAALIRRELQEDGQQYGDDRRTRLEPQGPATFVAPVLDEPVTITLSRQGWIRSRTGHHLDASQFSYKAGDGLATLVETRTAQPLFVLDGLGRIYTLRASEIPGGRGDGVPLSSVVDLAGGQRALHFFPALPGQRLLVAGSGGYGFLVHQEELISRLKGGKGFMTLEEGELPLLPVPLLDTSRYVAVLSKAGRLLLFPLSELKQMGRGRGLMLMALDAEDVIQAVTVLATEQGLTLQTLARNGKMGTRILNPEMLQRYLSMRARKGAWVDNKTKFVGFA